jgi:hypothetical protein
MKTRDRKSQAIIVLVVAALLLGLTTRVAVIGRTLFSASSSASPMVITAVAVTVQIGPPQKVQIPMTPSTPDAAEFARQATYQADWHDQRRPYPTLLSDPSLEIATQIAYETERGSLPTALGGYPPEPATQNAIATIGALKRLEATAWIIKMTTSPIPVGIPPGQRIFDAQGPTQKAMRGLGLIVQNIWTGNINDRTVSVYAGAQTANPDDGGLIVWDDDQHGGRHLFSVPGKHGAVKIVAEKNGRLTLASADQGLFYFDVPGLRFVNSLAEVIPTMDYSLQVTPSVPGVLTPTPITTAYP